MKITKENLKQIIKEEIAHVLDETNDLDETIEEPDMKELRLIVAEINTLLNKAETLQAIPLRPGTAEMLKNFVSDYLYGRLKKKRGFKGLRGAPALGHIDPIPPETITGAYEKPVSFAREKSTKKQ